MLLTKRNQSNFRLKSDTRLLNLQVLTFECEYYGRGKL